MMKKIDASVIISVTSAKFRVIVNHSYGQSQGYGFFLCTRDELFNPQKKYFVDGIMEIKLEGTLKSHGIKGKLPERLSLIAVLWEKEDDKDLTIAVKNEQIKIHKWILCAWSRVFKAEMESGMKEARENKIEITDFPFDIVKSAVEFCYERNTIDRINEDSVKFNANDLREFCVCFLMNSVQKPFKDAENLNAEIFNEIGRRSLL